MRSNPSTITVAIGSTTIKAKASIVIRNLGVDMHSTLTMHEHIKKVAKAMYFYIRINDKEGVTFSGPNCESKGCSCISSL